ncbi:MAG: 50S ribosomal protein L11 methyltransferase [Deltaproteobacteria bacterium]|nr:50S ribosomal protein L11 methyltransferase [Deltaproteobacteria bacterium]
MEPSSNDRPGWIEISVQSDPCTHEAVSHFLMETLGCDGVALDSRCESVLKAYLPSGGSPESLELRIEAFLAGLADCFPDTDPPGYRLGCIQDQDWRTAWRKHFRPERVTPGLLVVPAWEPVPRGLLGRVLRMDPGPAFGTGQHATTRMCLQALEDLAPKGPWSLLDVGTGSGILAMYGVLLGASPVEGLDVDEEALRWAEWNLELNDLSGAVRLSTDSIDTCRAPYTVVTANLILDVIQDLLPRLTAAVRLRGSLVLSGLLREQVPLVTPALVRAGFGSARELRQEEWACVVAERVHSHVKREGNGS